LEVFVFDRAKAFEFEVGFGAVVGVVAVGDHGGLQGGDRGITITGGSGILFGFLRSTSARQEIRDPCRRSRRRGR
jgi:hypothetical protein